MCYIIIEEEEEGEYGAGVRCGGGGVRRRREGEERRSAVSGRLPLSGVSGDLYGAGDSALHTHLLQGNTHTPAHTHVCFYPPWGHYIDLHSFPVDLL